MVTSGAIKDDTEAAQQLYNDLPNNYKYKMLKHRVKAKLYDMLLLYEFDNDENLIYQQEQYCQQLLIKANVLFRNQRFQLAVSIANKALSVAIMFSFTNQTLLAYELILSCYAFTGKHTLYQKQVSEYNKMLDNKITERKAQNIYQLMRVSAHKSVKNRRLLVAELDLKVQEVKELWRCSGTYEAFNSFYKLSILYYEMIGDFEKILQLTIFSEKLLAKGLVNKYRFDSLYNKYILVYALLRLKRYATGLEYATEYMKLFDERSANWFAFQENFYLLAIHEKNYELAEVVIHRVLHNNSINNVSVSAKERWKIYEAYLFVINRKIYSGKAINPFLMSLPEYSKDKQGFNVAILILQFIYYLQKKETEALLYRIESLKKYINTHLKDSFSLRSKLFLKLLILSVTEDFNAAACRKKGLKLYQKLIETPTPGDAYAEIEIVPYEHLWEHILSVLDDNY